MKQNQWPMVALGDNVEILAGFAFKSKRFTDDPDDIPLVKGANVHQGYIDWIGAKRWPRDEFGDFRRYLLSPGDVVVAMDRPWIEAGLKYAWISDRDPQSLLVQRVARIRGKNGLCQEYVRFLIGSHAFTDYIKPIVTGINVPHISATQISQFRFPLPPVETQRRIASILGAYDDLIENNLRRIRILEEMAQRLYREWFVHFRFPGHHNTPMTDSPLGPIPEGWEVKRLEEEIELCYGKALKAADRDGGEYPVYASSGIVGQHSKCLAQGPGIIVGRKGNVGSVFWSKTDFFVIDTAYFVKTDLPLHYIFYNLQDQNFINNDAAVPGLSRKQAYSLPLLKPEPVVLKAFEVQCSQIFSLKENLSRKNELLRQTRDMLLPRLISGDLAKSSDLRADGLPLALVAESTSDYGQGV